MNFRTVLYLEDKEKDLFFMRHAWKEAGPLNPLRVVTDGEQAMAYLSDEDKYADRNAHPCLAGIYWI